MTAKTGGKAPTITLKPGKYSVSYGKPKKKKTDEQHQAPPPESATDWYSRWRARIHQFVAAHTDNTLASILMLVPDLLILLIRLARDPRVPISVKGQLALAAAYVLSPLDLMPEGILGVIGLADDAGVLALVLYWLKGLGKVDPTVLSDNWPGQDNVETVIDDVHETIMANRSRIISNDVWRKIEQMFGVRTPERKAQVKARSAGKKPARRSLLTRVLARS